jgi:Xaa-Pro dipeptidase
MKDRVCRLFETLDHKVEVLYLENAASPHVDMTFFWVTGIGRGLFEGAVALAWPSGETEVLAPALEGETLRQYEGLGRTVYSDKQQKQELLRKRLAKQKRVGINGSELTHGSFLTLREIFPEIEFINVAEAIRRARLIKDSLEQDLLRRSCSIASKVAEELPGRLRPGMAENDVAAEIQYLSLRYGAGGMAFQTIVASGPYSAEPHYFGGERHLRAGEFLLFDFGTTYHRYCSDITRTCVLGEATQKQKQIHRAVAAMHQGALELVRPGVSARDVHLKVLQLLDAHGFAGKMPHSSGHSIGLAVHDGGRLSDKDDLTLQAGMVFTIEPGVYLPGYGGVRIEDDVIVSPDGPEFLTTAPRELTEVPV